MAEDDREGGSKDVWGGAAYGYDVVMYCGSGVTDSNVYCGCVCGSGVA